MTVIFLALKQYFYDVAISPFSGANDVSLCARNTTYQNNSLACREDMDEGENQLYALTIITHQSDLLNEISMQVALMKCNTCI